MEQNYLNLLKKVLEQGVQKEPARDNMPTTRSLFGEQLRFDLQQGFPLLTTKKVDFKNIVVELLWFLRGDTNIKYLVDNGCNIWNQDAYRYYLNRCKRFGIEEVMDFGFFLESIEEYAEGQATQDRFEYFENINGYVMPFHYIIGDCGKIYGKNWKSWNTHTLKTLSSPVIKIDQIKELIQSLKLNPTSRRHILSSWNVGTMSDAALPACHNMAQFNCRPISIEERCSLAVSKFLMHRNDIMFGDEESAEEETLEEQLDRNKVPKYKLDCHMYQRSADFFLGAPYNIASYALLTHILANICGMEVGDLIISYGDVHLYEDHEQAAREQLQREPKPFPTLKISGNLDIDKLQIEQFSLDNYNPHPRIKAKLSTGL